MRFLIQIALFVLTLAWPTIQAFAKDSPVPSDKDESIQVVDITRQERGRICAETKNSDTFKRLGCFKIGDGAKDGEISVALSTGEIIKICEDTVKIDTIRRLGCKKFGLGTKAEGSSPQPTRSAEATGAAAGR